MEIFKVLSKRIENFLQKIIDNSEDKIIHNKKVNSLILYDKLVSSKENEILIYDLTGTLCGHFTNDLGKLDIQSISDSEESQFNLTGHYVPYKFEYNFDAYYYLTFEKANSLICIKIKDIYYDENKVFTMKCEIIAPCLPNYLYDKYTNN